MVNPTGYTALDMIGFTDQGAYSSSDNYVKNDLVHYSGNIWRCLIDDTSGVEPTEGVNWTLFIGEPTNLVERIIAPVETDPATNSYAVGRQFIYNDKLYEVIVAITAGDSLVAYEDDPTNANIKLADSVETQLLYLKGNVSNRNLLDNPWFTVNQRGFTSASASQKAYTVDRWFLTFSSSATESISCVKNDNGVVITNNDTAATQFFCQEFDSYGIAQINNRTVTISVMTADGNIYTGTTYFVAGTSVPAAVTVGNVAEIRLYSPNVNRLQFVFDIFANSTVSIKAVKLELGSISTLAMDTAPNYAEELLKCQRYFVRYNSDGAFSTLCWGVVTNSTKTYGEIYLPTFMRSKPTISFSGTLTNYYGKDTSQNSAISNLVVQRYFGNVLKITATFATALSNGEATEIMLDAGSYLDVSADL